MKNKVIILGAVMLMLALTANSQSTGLYFGLRGGLNMQNINGKDMTGDKLTMTMVPRFHVGAVVGIPIAPEFYIQPGLLFSTKGAKSESDFLGLDMSADYNLSYIEMPLNFVYRPALGNGHFLLGFGPYVGYGILGKATFEVGSITHEEDIIFEREFESSSDHKDWAHFKSLDYGGNIFFGYELSGGLLVQINAQLGLAKINADNTTISTKSEFRNTGFGFSLGYNF